MSDPKSSSESSAWLRKPSTSGAPRESLGWSPRLVTVTPAYNEEASIAETIEGVLAQSSKPKRWVIVDDGSTDSTGEIVREYAMHHPWIRYHRRERNSRETYFGSNVHAIDSGVALLGEDGYDLLAILDADMILPADYYGEIAARFERDDGLGIASGVYVDRFGDELRPVLNDRRSTPKGLMVFRRACFSDIGGFVPMKHGGEDTCACVMARMAGWKVWSFPDLRGIHTKPVGTGRTSRPLTVRFHHGVTEYSVGSHPVFFFLKSLRRCVKERPYVLGGLARLMGYVAAFIRHEPRQVRADVLHYFRREQLARLRWFNKVPDSLVPSTPLETEEATS